MFDNGLDHKKGEQLHAAVSLFEILTMIYIFYFIIIFFDNDYWTKKKSQHQTNAFEKKE
jgi:hypothetical protein